MLILIFDDKYSAIEFKFQEVEVINLSFLHNIKPKAFVLSNSVEIHFNKENFIKAKHISFRMLTQQNVLGDRIKYGKYWEDLFD